HQAAQPRSGEFLALRCPRNSVADAAPSQIRQVLQSVSRFSCTPGPERGTRTHDRNWSQNQMLENRFLEILIIAAVLLLLFGANRLPEPARGLGKSLRIFKSEASAMKTDPAQPTPATPRTIEAAAAEPTGPATAPTESVHRVA